MALGIGNHHALTPDTNVSSPFTENFNLGDTTTAIILCITIYETGSGDGVAGPVTYGGASMTNSTITYDATCDGHISIWYLNGPNVAADQTLSITLGGTCTDVAGSITEMTGGNVAEESVATPNAGNGSPTISWSAAGAFSFAAMLDDQATASKVAVDAPGVQIFEADVTDIVGSQYVTGASETLAWTDDDADEDFVVAGAAYELGPEQVYKDMQAVWDIGELVNKDSEAKWDLLNIVNKDSEAKWDLLNLVNKDTEAKWDMRELVNKDTEAKWDMREWVNKDIEAKWDMFSLVNKSLQAVWDISSETAAAVEDVSYRILKKMRLGL